MVLYTLSNSLAVHNMTSLKSMCKLLLMYQYPTDCPLCKVYSCTLPIPLGPLLPYCYNANSNIAAYAMGVVTNIVIATQGGLSKAGTVEGEDQERPGDQELQEMGALVVESILVLNIEERATSLKVRNTWRLCN